MGKRPPTGRVSFTIPPEIIEELDKMAAEYDLSRAQIIKWLLKTGLNVNTVYKLGGQLVVMPPNGEPYLLASGEPYKLTVPNQLELAVKKLTRSKNM